MGIAKPIPESLRNDMASDVFYKRCCIRDMYCVGRIEWHHHKTYRGERINEKAFILPVCTFHHSQEKNKIIHRKLEQIAYDRGKELGVLSKYPRMTWVGVKK
jgi:hypothetical protein